jgi:hypothetical protein
LARTEILGPVAHIVVLAEGILASLESERIGVYGFKSGALAS